MKRIKKNAGLTLVELIVSSVLISIILLGVVSFNSSLSQIQNNTINNTSSNNQASVAMSYLRNDIWMATGDSTNAGIVTYSNGSPATISSLCLRQPDATPMDYTDNLWNCYFYDSSSQNLVRCEKPKVSLGPPIVPFNPQTTNLNTLDLCTTGASSILYLAKLQNGDFFNTGIVIGDPITITLNVIDRNSTYSLTSMITPLNHTQ